MTDDDFINLFNRTKKLGVSNIDTDPLILKIPSSLTPYDAIMWIRFLWALGFTVANHKDDENFPGCVEFRKDARKR